MATKKTEEEVEPVELSAEEVREAEIEEEDLLADLPPMRKPERLRIRQKNALKTIGIRHSKHLQALRDAIENDTDIPEEAAIGLLDLAADVDEFGESIALDKAAYERWSEKNADNIDVFVALLNRYMSAVGESNGSTS